MSTGRVYVIGAGMAGLAAATRLCAQDRPVTLIEAAPQAGGRCRSFHDDALGCDIDNGNHLVLSGNVDAMAYLARVGASDTVEIGPAAFPFIDIASGTDWTVALDQGRIPWWVLDRTRRVPGAGVMDYLRSLRVLRAARHTTVEEALSPTGALYELFWKPFAIAVLNIDPAKAAAELLIPVINETLAKGAEACRPVFAKRGLGFSFVDPALDYLRGRGADVRIGSRCREISFQGARAQVLTVDGESIELFDGDAVIVAAPPLEAQKLVPDIRVPDAFCPIVNAHFRIDEGTKGQPITGILGGVAEWLFVRGTVASVTVSAAETSATRPAVDLSSAIWSDIAPLLGKSGSDVPPHRIVKEKRATFAQTPEMVSKRPNQETRFTNLWLAGDWTDTGLPATIEGAIRSGHRAVSSVLNE